MTDTGIYLTRNGRWQVKICSNGSVVHGGNYLTRDEAVQVAAAIRMGTYVKKTREEKARDRFLARIAVADADACWEWSVDSRDRDGYGYLSYMGSQQLAHRVSYRVFVGPISEGSLIRHRCDNPPCVNPAHLTPGTHLDNSQDQRERNRQLLGLNHPQGRLTDDEVRGIRAAVAAGEMQKSVALRFGISQGYVSTIVSRKYRSAVTEAA